MAGTYVPAICCWSVSYLLTTIATYALLATATIF
jgi:hypothetical protein